MKCDLFVYDCLTLSNHYPEGKVRVAQDLTGFARNSLARNKYVDHLEHRCFGRDSTTLHSSETFLPQLFGTLPQLLFRNDSSETILGSSGSILRSSETVAECEVKTKLPKQAVAAEANVF